MERASIRSVTEVYLVTWVVVSVRTLATTAKAARPMGVQTWSSSQAIRMRFLKNGRSGVAGRKSSIKADGHPEVGGWAGQEEETVKLRRSSQAVGPQYAHSSLSETIN